MLLLPQPKRPRQADGGGEFDDDTGETTEEDGDYDGGSERAAKRPAKQPRKRNMQVGSVCMWGEGGDEGLSLRLLTLLCNMQTEACV